LKERHNIHAMIAATLIWIAGLLVAVPYAAWHLLFDAPREQYALLITFILFWIFGYWGIAGPIVMIVKVRSLWRRLEQAANQDDRRRLLLGPESQDVAIDLIASETRLPKFLARRVYASVVRRLATRGVDGGERSSAQ
jgi:hypothetical protein